MSFKVSNGKYISREIDWEELSMLDEAALKTLRK